jgi:hypothetical protein
MGTLPNTGSAIDMGRVRNAYGLTGQVRLRTDLGAQIGITTGAFQFSSRFGGRTTPNNY